jgi:deazaflavin-dependent oxidoreductase (nitroreductase family)
MPFPRWLARFNLHVTNRILGPLARFVPGMAVVVHTGRTTNHQYRTPVMVFRHEHDFVIALTYGRESQWVKNVLAQGGCELETTGRTVQLTRPRIVHDPERRKMPSIVRIFLGVLNVSDFLEMSLATETAGMPSTKRTA